MPGGRITSLVSFQTLRIRLVGPPVQNLTARPTAGPNGRAVLLSWDAYNCGAEGTTISIYRKEGCQDTPLPPCTTGPPPGYVKIAQLPRTATTYADTSALRRGVSYAYRLVAAYPDQNGGLNGGVSLASNQACQELPLLAPVITQVTVDSTDAARGRITVRWTPPIGLRPGDLAGPYQYRLLRASGQSGTSFSLVTTITTTNLGGGGPDTVFVDGGLNTLANAYRYQVEFYYTSNGALTRLDLTDAASSVRLAAAPAQRQLTLSWSASVPWSNDNQTHDIYRSRRGPGGPFNLIAQVRVGSAPYSYVDTGGDTYAQDGNTAAPLSADSSYCYRVLTRGQYSDAQLARLGVLVNYSQILCATPSDTARPCPPVLRVGALDCASLGGETLCDQTSFSNSLSWQPTTSPSCDPKIASYKIYYSRYQGDSLGAVGSVGAPTLSFSHTNLTTVAGCYYVTAVSSRGLESRPSNQVCVESCPNLVLPNVFTPNGDGKNDVFVPLRCPRFVEQVAFVVYNRWGAKVYASVGRSVSWDGKDSGGVDLPSGLYYYQALVRYGVLARNAPAQELKGWVQILREGVSMR